ncbi:hypothetical protein BCEN4_650017 [Burkholderia cenocepacia]|nr:hypothetical protein BCEN4_650017 [Burkholderia cenocepacia]
MGRGRRRRHAGRICARRAVQASASGRGGRLGRNPSDLPSTRHTRYRRRTGVVRRRARVSCRDAPRPGMAGRVVRQCEGHRVLREGGLQAGRYVRFQGRRIDRSGVHLPSLSVAFRRHRIRAAQTNTVDRRRRKRRFSLVSSQTTQFEGSR